MVGIKAMRARRKIGVVALLVALVAVIAFPRAAVAHPLGNFTINRYSRLDVGAAAVKVYYVLDMAEIPTYQEKLLIDSNGDGNVSDAEQSAYLARKSSELAANLRLSLNDTPATLTSTGSDLAFLQGQGGLETLRLTIRYTSPALAGDTTSLAFSDSNYADRVGWREMVVRNATGVALNTASVPATSQSEELRTYPEDMLASPLAVSAVTATFRLDPSVIVDRPEMSPAAQGVIDRAQDPFADLLKKGELSVSVILLAFGTAFVLGMGHALTPGHGKAVVGAYLVGARGTARHALFLGATVTVTHTLGVFALGFATLFASQYIVPDKLYPYLSLLSGVLVLVLGLTLFRSRIQSLFTSAQNHSNTHTTGGAHNHTYDFATAMPEDGTDGHSHDGLNDGLTHSHGGAPHTHVPPGTDGSKLTWRRLLVFGISAGLLPCPSALVVMLSSIALGRVAFGLVLIVFFSMGLAATLTGLGLLFVYARPLISRARTNALSRAVRVAPVLGALVVTVVGAVISYQGFAQTGLFAR